MLRSMAASVAHAPTGKGRVKHFSLCTTTVVKPGGNHLVVEGETLQLVYHYCSTACGNSPAALWWWRVEHWQCRGSLCTTTLLQPVATPHQPVDEDLGNRVCFCCDVLCVCAGHKAWPVHSNSCRGPQQHAWVIRISRFAWIADI
jgi:hypothetical protein